MSSRNTTLAALLATALFSVSAAFAQTPATPAAAIAPKAAAVNAPAAPVTSSKDAPAAKAEKKASAKSSKPFTAKTAKSKACSVRADEQKLRGIARKKFREECKKTA